jgi:uncharacterized protein YecE (DUF72 family)
LRHPGTARIGVSGWTYAPWRGHFYPRGLPQKRELPHLASVFPSVEVNGTFYAMQTPKVFGNWARQTDAAFIFAIKGPRFITHIKRLRNVAAPLANFFASGVLRLGTKLGPVLWQLPPSFRFDPAVIDAFLTLLPHDTHAAADLARSHDSRLKARAWLKTDAVLPIRHAIEIRHDSFCNADFITLLRRHGVALVCADTVEWPRLMDLTADFVYCRLHGSEELYRSGYDDAAQREWAKRIRAWLHGTPMRDGTFAGRVEHDTTPRDVYVYFDNTDKRHAPEDAQSLMTALTKLARRPPCDEARVRAP